MKPSLLRTAALFIIFNCSFIITKAQWVSIPDSNFGKWLNASGYSACMQGNNSTGWQMDTTCNAVVNDTMLVIQNTPIAYLSGIEYFDNLKRLTCQNNFQLSWLSTLPMSNYYLPHGLQYLLCSGNNLAKLPPLPSSLLYLDCSFNSSYIDATLPSLPNGLIYLNCNYMNGINSLPPLPSSLLALYCNDNAISTLGVLPSGLKSLSCFGNPIASIPILPNSLTYLACYNTQITSLAELPDTLTYLN